MKKVIVILGSPNKQSYTQKLVESILTTVEQKIGDFIWKTLTLSNNKILQCKGCGACFMYGCCYMNKEDDVGLIIEEIKQNDVVIWATPSYVNHLPGSMKNFIDRLASSTHKMDFAGKSVFTFITSSNSGKISIEEYWNDTLAWMGFKVIGNIGFIRACSMSEAEFIEDSAHEIIKNLTYNYGHSNIILERNFQRLKDMSTSIRPNENRFESNYWGKIQDMQIDSFQEFSNVIGGK